MPHCHPLSLSYRKEFWICGKCHREFHEKAAYHCAKCNYYECVDCYKALPQVKELPTETRAVRIPGVDHAHPLSICYMSNYYTCGKCRHVYKDKSAYKCCQCNYYECPDCYNHK